MRKNWPIVVPILVALSASNAFSEDLVKRIGKSAEMSTLDQLGITPFHLKATFAPSYERDNQSGRSGEIEIWWATEEPPIRVVLP